MVSRVVAHLYVCDCTYLNSRRKYSSWYNPPELINNLFYCWVNITLYTLKNESQVILIAASEFMKENYSSAKYFNIYYCSVVTIIVLINIIFLVPSFDLYHIVKASYSVYQTGLHTTWNDSFFSLHIWKESITVKLFLKSSNKTYLVSKKPLELHDPLPHQVDIVNFHSSVFLRSHVQFSINQGACSKHRWEQTAACCQTQDKIRYSGFKFQQYFDNTFPWTGLVKNNLNTS